MQDELVNSREETAPTVEFCRKPYTYRDFSCRSIPWTHERVARLKELWAAAELSASQIAKELGTSRNAVLGKVDRLGLSDHSDRHNQHGKIREQRPRERRIRIRIRSQASSEPEPIEPAAFLAITFAQLNGHNCHYPRGEDPMLFCGQPTSDGASYCPHCYRLTHEVGR